jgi:hypothetical protein
MSVHQEIIQNKSNVTFRKITSKVGLPIYEINGYVSNSKYNPEKEAEKIVETSYKKNHFHILLGIGAGYIAEKLYGKLSENDQMLVIEPNQEIFSEVMKNQELNFISDEKKVILYRNANLDDLEILIGSKVSQFNKRVKVIVSPNFNNIYPLISKKILSLIKDNLMIEVVNRNTLEFFSVEWQENFIRNLFPAFSSIPFALLKGKLNCPVVIASGGPSLTKQLPLIKEVRDKIFLISAGSTASTLLKNDIEPDAIVIIDGNPNNIKHFEELNIHHIPLFYSFIIQKEILRMHKGKQIIFNDYNKSTLKKWSEEILETDVGTVIGGPSVANYCLDIANQISNGPICLIGQDLAYTNNRSHSDGNLNLNFIDEKKIEERKMFTTEGYFGDEVLTDYPFTAMKKAFEFYLSIQSEESRIKIFNCTEGGANIGGMNNISFSEFIQEYCKKDCENETNLQLDNFSSFCSVEKWQRFYDIIRREMLNNDEVIRLSEKAKKTLSKINPQNPVMTQKILSKLSKLDNELKELLENEMLFYLLNDVVYKVLNYYLEEDGESEEQKNKRIYLKSKTLYEGIFAASYHAKNWYKDVLSEISTELTLE